jgi:hypothetical protein
VLIGPGLKVSFNIVGFDCCIMYMIGNSCFPYPRACHKSGKSVKDTVAELHC